MTGTSVVGVTTLLVAILRRGVEIRRISRAVLLAREARAQTGKTDEVVLEPIADASGHKKWMRNTVRLVSSSYTQWARATPWINAAFQLKEAPPQ
eukprot:5397693-Pyramimonas_sp.AAC.1